MLNLSLNQFFESTIQAYGRPVASEFITFYIELIQFAGQLWMEIRPVIVAGAPLNLF